MGLVESRLAKLNLSLTFFFIENLLMNVCVSLYVNLLVSVYVSFVEGKIEGFFVSLRYDYSFFGIICKLIFEEMRTKPFFNTVLAINSAWENLEFFFLIRISLYNPHKFN